MKLLIVKGILLFLLSPLAAINALGQISIVATKGGLSFEGRVSTGQSGLKITSDETEVYLTKAAYLSTQETPRQDQKIEYLFNEDIVNSLPAGRDKIGLVVTNSQRHGTSAEGITKMTLTDPILGELNFTLAIHRITPEAVHWVGIEYERGMSFPLVQNTNVANPLILQTIDSDKQETVIKAVRFFIDAGDLDRASALIERLTDKEQIAKARTKITETQGQLAFKRAKILLDRGQITEAKKALNQILKPKTLPAPSTKNQEEDTILHSALLDEIKNQTKAVALAQEWIQSRAFNLELPDRASLRLSKFCETEFAATLSEETIIPLTQRWAESIPELTTQGKITPEEWSTAINLASLLGDFLVGDDQNLTALATKFAQSSLPVSLRLDILKFAPPSSQSKWSTNWEKVDFEDPLTGKKFHYYLSFPPNFDPSTPIPLLVTLHGMTTKADVMRQFWGRTADEYGYIMISPEYIYGRTHGFHYTEEEVRSILGAVEHASRTLPVDSSRVLLQGHSQGGHTAWEIGCAGAHRFSGIIPMLGITTRNHALAGYGDTPLYLIDGDLDGPAPERIRKSMGDLGRIGIDATYVEYINRHHEAFYEEYPRVMRWARSYQRKIAPKEDFTAYRPSDCRRDWIEILETKTELPKLNFHGEIKATLKAELRQNLLRIDATNVRKIAVHVPLAWRDLGVLSIDAGGNRSRAPIKADWKTMLKEIHRTGDRENLVLETRIITLN